MASRISLASCGREQLGAALCNRERRRVAAGQPSALARSPGHREASGDYAGRRRGDQVSSGEGSRAGGGSC